MNVANWYIQRQRQECHHTLPPNGCFFSFSQHIIKHILILDILKCKQWVSLSKDIYVYIHTHIAYMWPI